MSSLREAPVHEQPSEMVLPRAPVSEARGWRPSRAAVITLVLGLLVTAALSLTALGVYNRNESRLLKLRVRELNLVLGATAPSVQTPLASAAELANATAGSPQKFRQFIAPYVGSGRQFTSVSLWPLGKARLAPTVVVGPVPQLASQPARAQQFFRGAKRTGALNVTGMLDSPHPAIGFEFRQPGAAYAVFAENALPANRRSRIETNSAFSDLNYALFLGRTTSPSQLVVTSVKRLPLQGRKASEAVPFGTGVLTLVVAPRGSLGGSFFQDLPWIIAIVGVLITLAAAMITDRLVRGRHRAERLAGILDRVAAENRAMYTEQRSISQTLQRALLPERLPTLDGLRVSALYVPAASGVDVGGDWYDVVALDERRALLLIGDVSGHGLRAATTMALLRHAALAYVAEDSHPATVLAKLSEFVQRSQHDYFATVLCALIDVEAHTLTVSSAGHLAPLLLDDGRGEFVDVPVDPAIGVSRGAAYREATTAVPAHATLVAFTDGLVERRGEVLDVGLERLRELASRQELALDELLGELARELASDDHHDDTAMVGVQWRN